MANMTEQEAASPTATESGNVLKNRLDRKHAGTRRGTADEAPSERTLTVWVPNRVHLTAIHNQLQTKPFPQQCSLIC